MHSLQKTLKNDYKSNSLSHAYLIGGDTKGNLEEVFSFFDEHTNISTLKNPDFSCTQFETFTIKDARELKERAYVKKSGDNKKIFIIIFNFITREAQNSLLKVFEEPPLETHFFILTENAGSLLPTLKSRLTKISPMVEMAEKNELAEEFLKKSPADRMKMFEKIIKQKEKDSAIKVLNEIEKTLYYSKKISEKNKDEVNALKEISKCREFLYTPSPSVKMILEHISLVTPVFK